LYPSADEQMHLQRELGLENSEEWSRLLKTARGLLRHGTEAITEEHRSYVREYLRASRETTIPGIHDDAGNDAQQNSIMMHAMHLEKQMTLSREQIYKLLLMEQYKLDRRKATGELRQIVEAFVSENGAFLKNNVKVLCNQLEQILPLPRKTLYELIVNGVVRVQRRGITEEHKEIVLAFVRQQDDLSNIAQMSDAFLLSHSDPFFHQLPRQLLYEIFREASRRLKRKTITAEQREIVASHVNSHTSENKDTSILCNELASLVHLPRFQLYNLVRRATLKKQGSTSTATQRRLINKLVTDEYFKWKGQKEDDSQREVTCSQFNLASTCDSLQNLPELKNLARARIYQIARNRFRKLVQKHLTQDERKTVSRIVEENVSERNADQTSSDTSEFVSISSLCDKANAHVDLPRDVLYHLVRVELQKQVDT